VTHDFTYLIDARREVFDAYTDANGTTCPCCDQHVKLYRWSLQCGMVLAMVYLVNKSLPDYDWVHMNSKDVPSGVKESRSFPKLVHWNLIEPKPKQRGWWRPTQRTFDFLRGAPVPRRIYVYNDKCVDISEELCTVHDAYGEKFDYHTMVHLPAYTP